MSASEMGVVHLADWLKNLLGVRALIQGHSSRDERQTASDISLPRSDDSPLNTPLPDEEIETKQEIPGPLPSEEINTKHEIPRQIYSGFSVGGVRGGARGIRILSLDGGGIRGLLLLQTLEKLEARIGRPIQHCFDIIVGTSTGGVVALALSIGISLEVIKGLYSDLMEAIAISAFSAEWKRLTTGVSHDTNKAVEVLQRYFPPHLKLSSHSPSGCAVAVVTTLASVTPLTPFLFKNYSHGEEDGGIAKDIAAKEGKSLGAPVASSTSSSSPPPTSPPPFSEISHTAPLWVAARATSSAPTYYDVCEYQGHKFVDGALFANNPTLFGLGEAKQLFPHREVEVCVSVGTGRLAPRSSPPPQYLFNWSLAVLDCCTSPSVPHLVARQLLSVERSPGGENPRQHKQQRRYWRFDPPLSEVPNIADCDRSKLKAMQEEGAAYLEGVQEKIEGLAVRLRPL